ncbi:hypothetical protein AXF42_Ash019274 [Apostasia shenzhenica]|uniref:DUF4218 domain-containing protein n=1 Tax=Apostasia shenzhenica TaxID=1088818 RepID=A0A2I0AR84_9ASPA|nr:hypothetical protein AXF42_Ash019274 [Apostasia shenzhenica]
MDRSWMRMDRRSFEYRNGVKNFIEFALNNSISSQENMRYSCLKCGNMKLFSASIVKDHLFFHGIDVTYEQWIWHAKSILFELEYWESLYIRHNLDVMHIERNICDNIIETLLNISGKSKDGLNTLLDMMDMGIREQLTPKVQENRIFLPHACYTLTKEERKRFCRFLYELKMPEKYSSNIRSHINLKDCKLINLKSHDCHVLMQQLLPIAIRGSLDVCLRNAITKICIFINSLCAKVVDHCNLDALQSNLIETLCELEIFFSPHFFDVIVHLTVHLVREVKLCGSIFMRWMYPFERYIKILKRYVRNRYRPEACIIESYVTEEIVEYCTEYLHDVNPIGISVGHNLPNKFGKGLSTGKPQIVDMDLLNQAHLYVLRNTIIIDSYI